MDGRNLISSLRPACLAMLVAGNLPATAQDLPPVSDPVFAGDRHVHEPRPFDQEHVVIDVRFLPHEGMVIGRSELHVRPLEPLREIVLMAADMEIDSVLVTIGNRPPRQTTFRLGEADSFVVHLTPPPPASPDTLSAQSADTTAPGLPDGSAPGVTSGLASGDTLGDPFAPDAPIEPDAATEADTVLSRESASTLEDLAVSEPFTIITHYRAKPRTGLYFVAPERHPGLSAHELWTQGEPEGHRHWFPLYDHPSDKLTSEVIATVDSALQVLSNGSLRNVRANGDGTTTFHYAQNQPHAPYLITLVAGDYERIDRSVQLANRIRLPISFWTFPDRREDAVRTLGRTAEILSFFSEKTGVPYPWDQYAQIFVREFMWGGMENTGATTLTEGSLVDERAWIDYDPDGLIAHEAAHQWFGNLVTTRDWSNIWLNEGFATYAEAAYQEEHVGPDEFSFNMLQDRDTYFRETRRYLRPLVWDRWLAPIDLFDRHAYQKGGWVLHMLRREVGDESFWNALQHYLEEHAYGPVTTDDFEASVEAVLGDSYGAFFDQWVRSAGHPVLQVRYTHNAEAGKLRVVIEQVQEGELVPDVFDVPLTLEVQSLGGADRYDLELKGRVEDFTFDLGAQPRFVLPDPDLNLLAEIRVDQPAAAWVAQLRAALEPVSRALAARALRSFASDPALPVGLRTALENEPSARVRTEIVKTLGVLPHARSVERMLLTASQDEAPLVRRASVDALGRPGASPEVISRLTELAHGDVSYSVQAGAVRALARAGAPNALDIARSALVTPSFRDSIRTAAFDALALLKLPASEGVQIALEYAALPQPTRARAGAVTYLGKLAHENEQAMNALLALLDDPVYLIRARAITALRRIPGEVAAEALGKRVELEPEPRLRSELYRAIQMQAALD